jgi:hypothetical protein
MLNAIDGAKAGSVYVMVLDDGLDFAGIGGLMATHEVSRAGGRGDRRLHPGHAAYPEAAVSRIQPGHRALHHDQLITASWELMYR